MSLHISTVGLCISIHVGRVGVNPVGTGAVGAGAIGGTAVVVLGVGGENGCDDCNEEHK